MKKETQTIPKSVAVVVLIIIGVALIGVGYNYYNLKNQPIITKEECWLENITIVEGMGSYGLYYFEEDYESFKIVDYSLDTNYYFEHLCWKFLGEMDKNLMVESSYGHFYTIKEDEPLHFDILECNYYEEGFTEDGIFYEKGHNEAVFRDFNISNPKLNESLVYYKNGTFRNDNDFYWVLIEILVEKDVERCKTIEISEFYIENKWDVMVKIDEEVLRKYPEWLEENCEWYNGEPCEDLKCSNRKWEQYKCEFEETYFVEIK